MIACEGLQCPLKEKCQRYEKYLESRDMKKYVLVLFPHNTDTGCADIILKK